MGLSLLIIGAGYGRILLRKPVLFCQKPHILNLLVSAPSNPKPSNWPANLTKIL
jgi:hypothetical protein